MSRLFMSSMSHPTQDDMGEDPPPLDYNVPEGTSVELPVDFEFVPYLNPQRARSELPRFN